MYQLSQSDSLRYVSGEITENDVRQSKLDALTLLNAVYSQEAVYHSALIQLNNTWEWLLIHFMFLGKLGEVDAETLPCQIWSKQD